MNKVSLTKLIEMSQESEEFKAAYDKYIDSMPWLNLVSNWDLPMFMWAFYAKQYFDVEITEETKTQFEE